jgi:Amt family ammonium transporter
MIALAIVIIYTFVGSMIILKVTDLLSSLTVTAEEKKVGSDLSQHGENVFPFDLSTAKEF